jgi:hypothetical protein
MITAKQNHEEDGNQRSISSTVEWKKQDKWRRRSSCCYALSVFVINILTITTMKDAKNPYGKCLADEKTHC